MTCYRVSQVGLLILSLCRLWGGTAYPLDCNNEEGSYMHCTSIPLDKLLDRAIQHAELLYNLSEESCAIFEERFVPSRLRSQKYRTSCYNKEFTLAIPNSKPEVQKLSDKWLLHSVLLLAQSWIEPFLYLQSSLKHYDSVPAALLDKTKWLSDKLSSLEQGVVVLMRKVVDEGPLAADYQQTSAYLDIGPRTVESVLQDYMILDCFRKDAHKIETFLRLLKCRWTNTLSCYPSEAGLSVHGGPLLAS